MSNAKYIRHFLKSHSQHCLISMYLLVKMYKPLKGKEKCSTFNRQNCWDHWGMRKWLFPVNSFSKWLIGAVASNFVVSSSTKSHLWKSWYVVELWRYHCHLEVWSVTKHDPSWLFSSVTHEVAGHNPQTSNWPFVCLPTASPWRKHSGRSRQWPRSRPPGHFATATQHSVPTRGSERARFKNPF